MKIFQPQLTGERAAQGLDALDDARGGQTGRRPVDFGKNRLGNGIQRRNDQVGLTDIFDHLWVLEQGAIGDHGYRIIREIIFLNDG